MAEVLESAQSTVMETLSFLKDLVENFAEFVSVNFQTHVQDRLKMLLENKNESDQEMMDPRSNNNDKKDQLFKLATQVFCRDIACRMMEFLDVKSMVRLSSVCKSAHQSLAIEVQRRKDRVSAIEVKIQDLLNGPQEHHQDVDDDASTSSSFYQPTKDQFEEALVLQQEARTWIDSGLGWLDHEYDPDFDPKFHLGEEGTEEQPCPICSCDTLFGDIRISKMKCHSQEQVVTHGLAILPKLFYTALQDKIIIESVHLSPSGEDASLSHNALEAIFLLLWEYSLRAVRAFHEDESLERTDAAFYYDPDHTLRLLGPDAAGGSSLEDLPLTFHEILVFHMSQVMCRVSMVSFRSVAREFVQSHPSALPLLHCVLMTAERGLVNMIVGMIENHMAARRTSIEDVDEGEEDINEDGDDEFVEHDSDDGYYAEEDGDESEWEDEYEEEDDECEDGEEDEASASSEMDDASGSSSEASSADHGDEEGDL